MYTMRRPPSHYLLHSYALMAVGAALTVFLVVQLVQYAQATNNGAWILVAGLITAAYAGLVAGILLYCRVTSCENTRARTRARVEANR
jgi:hypothetical protein